MLVQRVEAAPTFLEVFKLVSKTGLPTRLCLIHFWTPGDCHKSWHTGLTQETSQEFKGEARPQPSFRKVFKPPGEMGVLPLATSPESSFHSFLQQMCVRIGCAPSIMLEMRDRGSQSSKEESRVRNLGEGGFHKDCVEWEKKHKTSDVYKYVLPRHWPAMGP